jgi:manganese transport protein
MIHVPNKATCPPERHRRGVRAPTMLRAVRSLLVWTVLTASTIGPGTVTMCSKAGADYGTALFWCVAIAALVAWVMQEGTGRLTIMSGFTLGEAARSLSPSGAPLVFRHLLAAFCLVGNFAYECNNFAGTMAAVEILLSPPGLNETVVVDCSHPNETATPPPPPLLNSAQLGVRQSVNVLLWPLSLLLYLAGTRRLSLLCSGVVAGMIVCFVVTLAGAGLPSASDMLAGLLPTIPDGSAEVVLAVMGTTSIPVNILMGSSLARDAESLSAMRQGVALASSLSGIISLLVQLVATHVPPHPPCVPFTLRDVARVLQSVMGPAGMYGFGVGLFGAGLSSALTIPLGCALSLEDLYGWRDGDGASQGACDRTTTRRDSAAALAYDDGAASAAAAATAAAAAASTAAKGEAPAAEDESSARRRRLLRPALMAAFLGLSIVPSLLRWPTIAIITTAQVVNGVLLPCVASLLLVALNHSAVMGGAGPQSATSNGLMIPCVAITIYLASVVLLKQTVGRIVGPGGSHVAIAAAAPVAAVLLLLLLRCVQTVRRAPARGPLRPGMLEVTLPGDALELQVAAG